MPVFTYTEGPDVVTSGYRSSDPDIFMGIYLLGGADRFTNTGYGSHKIYMGAGNDYALINKMYQAIIYGEGGDDVVDINHSMGWTFFFDGGDGADRANFLIDKLSFNILGGLGNDSFNGNAHIVAGTIDGGAGNDLFSGFGNRNGNVVALIGGSGNDTYYVDPSAPPTIVEASGGGTDTVVLLAPSASYVRPANVENLVVQGAPPPPPPPSNTITGDGLDNILAGGSAADSIYGLGGNDTLRGYAANDLLDGGTGNDRLYGGSGNDMVYGGDGSDQLRGDSGRDEVWGGAGADTFIFADAHFGGASVATCDVIHDFNAAQGDKVRLNGVDANSNLLSDQAFAFIGTAAFSHSAGQLRYEQIGGNTFVQGDVNGDAIADFCIRLDGLHNLNALNFML